MSHLYTLLDLSVFFQAQACDIAGQHASMRPDELTEQQHILIVIFVLQVPTADGALA